jgi:hypothetical protein
MTSEKRTWTYFWIIVKVRSFIILEVLYNLNFVYIFLILGNIEGSFQGLDMKKRFSVESELMSKIAPHTPSTFMRRSFEIENYYTKEGNVKGEFEYS